MQQDVGLRTATDGEFRRASWHMDFIYELGGIRKVQDAPVGASSTTTRATSSSPRRRRRSTARIALPEPIFADAFSFLASTVSKRQTPKLTIPSPSMVHYRGGRAAIDEDVYPDLDAFWGDLTAAYADQVRAIGRARLHATCSSTTRASRTSTTPSSASTCADRAATPSTSTRPTSATSTRRSSGRPDGMAVTTHMCRGNFRSSWVAEGGYDFVAEALFGELDVDGFFMEWDDARSGGFEPLRFVPEGQGRRARPRHHQARRARVQGRAQAPHRGGDAVRGHRPALPLAAVRLLLDGRGQRPQLRSSRLRSCGSWSRSPRRSGAERRLRLRRDPHAVRPPRRRAGRRAAGRPGRPRRARAARALARPRPGADRRRRCSATPTARARTTATSPGWRCCWPACRRACRAPPSTGCAAPRWTPRCRRRARSRPATRRSIWSAASSR